MAGWWKLLPLPFVRRLLGRSFVISGRNSSSTLPLGRLAALLLAARWMAGAAPDPAAAAGDGEEQPGRRPPSFAPAA